MISYRKARVVECKDLDEKTQELLLEVDGLSSKAFNYTDLTARAKVGDYVTINTTARELGLGTGGLDFVIYNHSVEEKEFESEGHIMKMRYAPMQLKCLAVEEENSPYHEKFKEFTSLNKHICIVGTLHSMLAPIVLMLKYIDPSLKINYIMTDGGCLPISFSNTVRRLKDEKLINKTITIGHAFGGDLEAINIYSGLIASQIVGEGDITIVTMGPGIVGSSTKYGFTGVEQGDIINAVDTLGGIPILVPRVGFSDLRERHLGLSQQTQTVARQIVKVASYMPIHTLTREKQELIDSQLEDFGENIKVIYRDGRDISKALEKFDYNIKTMGRDINDEEDYFYTLGAVAGYAYELFEKEDL